MYRINCKDMLNIFVISYVWMHYRNWYTFYSFKSQINNIFVFPVSFLELLCHDLKIAFQIIELNPQTLLKIF